MSRDDHPTYISYLEEVIDAKDEKIDGLQQRIAKLEAELSAVIGGSNSLKTPSPGETYYVKMTVTHKVEGEHQGVVLRGAGDHILVFEQDYGELIPADAVTVLRRIRYDGTPSTLPDESKEVVLWLAAREPSKEPYGDAFLFYGKWENDGCLRPTVPQIGDEWAYWPE